MRKFLSFSAVACIVVVLVHGCKPVPTQLLDSGSMTANISGSAPFNASSCYETFVEGKTEDWVIKGTGDDGVSYIVIDIKKYNYTVGADIAIDSLIGGNYAQYISHGVVNNIRWAQNGTVHINSDSPGVAIQGTFSFNTTNSVSVSNGVFRAVYHK